MENEQKDSVALMRVLLRVCKCGGDIRLLAGMLFNLDVYDSKFLAAIGDNVRIVFAPKQKEAIELQGPKGHDADYGPNGKKGVKLVTRLRPMAEWVW